MASFYSISGYNPVISIIYELCHLKMCVRAYRESKGSNHPAHSHSLIRAMIVQLEVSVYKDSILNSMVWLAHQDLYNLDMSQKHGFSWYTSGSFSLQ